jgi:hypothetical protein
VQTAKIALGATNPAEQLGACLVIVELWLPHLRDAYQAFFNAVLDPAVAAKVGFVGG